MHPGLPPPGSEGERKGTAANMRLRNWTGSPQPNSPMRDPDAPGGPRRAGVHGVDVDKHLDVRALQCPVGCSPEGRLVGAWRCFGVRDATFE